MKFQRMILLTSAVVVCFFSSLFLSGCAAEKGNPLGTQTIGGSPTGGDSTVRDFDARGIINGVFHPRDQLVTLDYPIRYRGSWTLIPQNGQAPKLFAAVSNTAGDSVNVVGSFTRAVIEFYDPRMYQNPGRVGFSLNDSTVGTFDLARQDSSGNQIIEYVIANPNVGKVATITVSVLQGSVVITGYWLVYP